MAEHHYSISIVAGVLSSLIAIGLVEVYRGLRQSFTHRSLKNVLRLHFPSCTIVSPIFSNPGLPDQWSRTLVHYRDGYAFGHLFNLCQRVGVEASLIPHNKLSEYQELQDILCVGGPISNSVTSRYLRRNLPGVCVVDGEGQPSAEWKRNGGFVIGSRTLLETDTDQYAFLAKITEAELGQQRTVHLLFGFGAMGTAAASYLWKHFSEIHKQKGKGRYFIALKFLPPEGYKSVHIAYDDYTDEAFSRPQEAYEKANEIEERSSKGAAG